MSEALSLVFSELDLLIEETSRKNFSDESRQTVVSAVDSLSFEHINQQWQSHIAVFRDSLPALRIFGEGLDGEGPPIGPGDLNSVRDAVLSLREEVKNSTLPDLVKTFVYEQLNSIERAIREYPTAGIKAFRTAAKDTWFREIEHPEEAKAFEQTESGSKLKAMIAKIREWSKVAMVITGLLAAGNSAVENAEKLEHTVAEVVHKVSTVIHHPK